MNTNPPTDHQKKVAGLLGIVVDEIMTSRKLQTIINAALARLSLAAMKKQSEIKVTGIVEFRNNRYMITAIDRTKWKVRMTPTVEGKGEKRTCYILALSDPRFDFEE